MSVAGNRTAFARVLESADGAHALREPAANASLSIRPLRSLEDCGACVDLQREIWGFDEGDVVPASLLHVVDYVGGIAAGAFDTDGTLLGFVFGISGVHEGELAHWSHMLGVRESARNMGVGRLLKAHQRSALAHLGVARIFWTFDPLLAKNAYFNLNRLGVTVVEYVPNMYGVTASPLHLGLPTDRLVVSLATAQHRAPPLTLPPDEELRVMTAFPRLGDHTLVTGEERPPIVLLELPPDTLDHPQGSPSASATWRMSLREYFQWALRCGYSARGVHRNATSGRSFYVMVRDT